MLLDLVWLLRQGNPYGSGVAAAALAQYDHPSCSTAFLAAVAACPAVALLWSPHSYGQHSAARLLAQLARATPSMPEVLVEAGAVRGLLQQLDLRWACEGGEAGGHWASQGSIPHLCPSFHCTLRTPRCAPATGLELAGCRSSTIAALPLLPWLLCASTLRGGRR
jgi:hypothetical protein